MADATIQCKVAFELELPGTNAIRVSSATSFDAFCHIRLNVSSCILQPDSKSRLRVRFYSKWNC